MSEHKIETKFFYRGVEVPARHVRNRHTQAFRDGVNAVLDINDAVQPEYPDAGIDFDSHNFPVDRNHPDYGSTYYEITEPNHSFVVKDTYNRDWCYDFEVNAWKTEGYPSVPWKYMHRSLFPMIFVRRI